MKCLSRRLLAACLLVAGMAGVGFAQTTSELKPVACVDGHFHVAFPGDPEVGAATSTTYSGAPITVHSLRVEKDGGNIAYLVAYNEIPAENLKEQNERGVTDSDRLASGIKEVAARFNTNVVAEKTIIASGVIGKEVVLERPGELRVVYRLFLKQGRYYAAYVAWKGTGPAADDVNNFLDSFVLDS